MAVSLHGGEASISQGCSHLSLGPNISNDSIVVGHGLGCTRWNAVLVGTGLLIIAKRAYVIEVRLRAWLHAEGAVSDMVKEWLFSCKSQSRGCSRTRTGYRVLLQQGFPESGRVHWKALGQRMARLAVRHPAYLDKRSRRN